MQLGGIRKPPKTAVFYRLRLSRHLVAEYAAFLLHSTRRQKLTIAPMRICKSCNNPMPNSELTGDICPECVEFRRNTPLAPVPGQRRRRWRRRGVGPANILYGVYGGIVGGIFGLVMLFLDDDPLPPAITLIITSVVGCGFGYFCAADFADEFDRKKNDDRSDG